ncbi:MAG: hypothetical protein LQ337_004072, partial [Flavoplaca oasis]
MWNRILGKSSELDKKSSTSQSPRKSETQRSTPRRSESQKSTTSSRKTTRTEEHDRGFKPTSTSYSSTTQNPYPGTASASIASSYATAFNDPTSQDYLPPGLVRNASLADQVPKTLPGHGHRTVALDSGRKSDRDRDDTTIMEEKPRRRERRGTREKDDERRESRSHRDKKRRNSEKGAERVMSTDNVARGTSQRSEGFPQTSSGIGSSAFGPLVEQQDHGAEYPNDRPHTQSTHIQDQFPGQFPAQSAAPYRPPLAASEGGPGLAAEYYGDAGQSVVDQPGVRIHSPSLIVGAEPHLQAASVVAAPPPEPSASGGVGAAASFFDGTFSAGSDMEGHSSQKPAPTTGSSSLQHSSAATSTSAYTTAGARPSSHQSASAPMIPTVGSAAAGEAAGYYMSNRPSKPERPDQDTSSTADFSKLSGSSSHHKPSETHDPYSSYPSSSRPSTRPGKHSSQSSNMPLYAAGAAGMAAAAYHHNHHGATNHGSAHHASSHHSSHGQHYRGGSMAQQYRHRHQGPFSTFVDFFKDPDGVAQFEEYTEFIGVCRHCFDPHSSPRDAPRKHHYRRRRSDPRFGSTVRVDKDHRYSSSESESRRRRNNKSWLGAGIAGYGLGKMGESLFLHDSDSHGSHSDHGRKVKPSHRQRSSSSSERKSRTSYGVVNRSSNTPSRKSHSDDRTETGITSDGKVYRRNSHGNIDTSKVKNGTSRHRSRSRSRDRHGNVSNMALGATLGSSVATSHSRRRSKSPKKAFIRSKHGKKVSSSELASILKLSESDPRDSRRQSRHSPESRHRKDRRKEKKSRGFFSFSNSSSSSSTSSDLGFGTSHDQKSGRKAKTRRKDKENRDAEAALLGLGAAALAFNQSQRPKRKTELIAVKESQGKHRAEKHGRKGKRSSSSSEEDPWESASEGEYSSADTELAYGGSLHRRSQESLSSESSGLDKWDWRWGSKKQTNRAHKDRHHSSTFDNMAPVAASAAMMTGARNSPPSLQDQDNRMTSTSDIPLQHVYPMPTSDPTQFDVARQDSGAPPYQPWNARPNPVPIQHPQPVAPVSSAVYTSQAPYTHSYSAPIGQSSRFQHPHTPSSALGHDMGVMDPRKNLPGAFPTREEYFESSAKDPERDPKSRRRESSPVSHTPEYTPASGRPPRRKSLKDDASSVRFDLTQEQEDKDRRDERRRRKEEDKRQERLEQRESDEGRSTDSDVRARQDVITTPLSAHVSRGSEGGIRREPWAAPAAAGIIAAAIGATVSAEVPSNDKFEEERRREQDERDIEVIVRERSVAKQEASSDKGRGYTSKKTGMSVWQAAAKVKKAPNHTEYAAYFTPPELLSKEPGVKETVGANADNDITVYQVPNMITIQPSELRGQSPSRAYSFPITAEDMEQSVKKLPWAVPQLNLVEATPPTSRTGSVVSSHSPRVRSPLSNEIADIPLEPLESVASPDPSPAQPAHVEYTVIEPKGHSTGLVDSPVSDEGIPESVPGISSLKKKQKHGRKSPRDDDYRNDLDFIPTVAAGLQDTSSLPSIVVDDPSFLQRDSPPGSGDAGSRKRPTTTTTTTVTEVAPEIPTPPSPPHGFVEEIDEPHVPGSFGEDEGKPRDSFKNTENIIERSRSPEELTGPSDNADREPNVYSTEQDAFKHEDLTNAAIDPVGERPHNRGEQVKHDPVTKDATEPSDNAGVNPYVYTAEPEHFESEVNQNVAIDPMPTNQRSAISLDDTSRAQPQVEVNTNGNTNVDEYMSDGAPSVAASAPLPSSRRKDSKSSKKSKRRSVGFDDNTSVIPSPPTYGGKQDPSSTSKSGRKGGIFGLFSKSTDDLSDSKGIQQTPVEASLEDFEEPKERKKKSKTRRQDRDEEVAPVGTESVVSSTPDVQDDWDMPKKSKRGKEKRRSSGDPGRITQDLPAQVIPPASSGHNPFPTLDEMLTSLEDYETGHSLEKTVSDVALNEISEPSRVHDNQQPSFLGERPEKPPLPDTPDASEDPGGQMDLQRPVRSEQVELPPADQSEPSTKTPQMPNRSISDFQSDGRSVSFPSASPTAIPLRPLRFGRRPSSPGLAKSLPSTPQPSTTADTPFTPRRRERPHSTEFKSNEFRPMWLLEKYGARQEPILQDTYPSLPSSHSTSRASSIHESDDLYRTEALDLALDEANYRRFMQEPRGLKIDTSHTVNDPGLLDSQQTTPTAASFQSMAKEGSMHPLESAQPSTSGIRDLNPESVDLVSSASAHHGPLDRPSQDQRLLHGVEDLFPQRRATSPSRYEAGVEPTRSEQRKLEAPELDAFGLRGRDGQEPMVLDVAAEDPSGGSAAAVLKSNSQHDKLLKQSSSLSDSEQISKAEEALAPKAAVGGPERPTFEETRLMQEQDAQDAVDSWFAPAQSKRPSLTKKGRKRGKSYEETQSTSTTEPSGSMLGDTLLTAEPGEATLTGTLEDERSEPVADLNYQAALTSRRDSTKGKKKKGKRKTTDPPETPTESPSLFAEQHFDPEFIEKQSPIFTEPSTIEPSSIRAIPTKKSPGLLAETEISPANEVLHPALEGEPFVASTKKSKKGKKKSRSLSLVDPEQGQAQGADVPTKTGSGESQPSNEVSEEVPYEFSQPEEPRTEEPVDSFQAADQPPTGDISTGFEQIGTPPDFNFEKSLEDRIAEVTSPVVFQSSTSKEDLPPNQRLDSPAAASPVSPKTIPLPLDDDLDLHGAPPESPVLQPIDVPPPGHDQSSEDRDVLIEEPVDSNSVLDRSLMKASNIEPTTLNRAISKLVLPQSAAATENIENEEDCNFSLSTTKKSKKDKMSTKIKGFQDPAFEAGPPAEEPTLPTIVSVSDEPKNGPKTIAPVPRNEKPPEASDITDNPGGLREEMIEIPQEQPADKWPDFTAKKTKKEKKELKHKSIREDPKGTDLDSSVSVIDPAPLESSTASAPGVLPKPLEISDVEVPTKELKEVESTQSALSKREPSETMGAPTAPVNEVADEWPSMSKKKKKGKKGKGVQFGEVSTTQPVDMESADISEKSLATTGTASEVRDLLRDPALADSGGVAQNKSSETTPIAAGEEPLIAPRDQPLVPARIPSENNPEGINDTHLLESSSLQVISQERLPDPAEVFGASETTTSVGVQLHGADSKATATTETANEVQEMLDRAEELETLRADRKTTGSPEQATEVDDFAWASLKKKKKGKRSKVGEEAAAADILKPHDQQTQEPPENVLDDNQQNVPVNELETKKSRKDKKGQRKGLSRSASNIEEAESQQDNPLAIEEPAGVAMAMTDNAPSILEKPDQLPSLEMPKSPEARESMPPLMEPGVSATVSATKELEVSATARDIDTDPNYEVSKPPTATEESSQLPPPVEEMKISADAPSLLEKQDNSPSFEPPSPGFGVSSGDRASVAVGAPLPSAEETEIFVDAPSIPEKHDESLISELPLLADSNHPTVDRETITLGAPADESHNNKEPPLYGYATATAEPTDTKPALEESAEYAGAPALSVSSNNPLGGSPLDESKEVAEVGVPIMDETTQPEMGPSFKTPVKSRKDRKKSENFKASAWEDDIPMALAESSTVSNDEQEGFTDPKVEHPTMEIIADNEIVETQVLPMSKRGQKKGKKAKQSAWGDDVSEAVTENIEPLTEFVEAGHEQPSEAIIEDTPAIDQEPSQSKKDKKTLKKATAFGWEENDELSIQPAADSSQADVPIPEAEVEKEVLSEPLEKSAEIGFETPISMKGKKKGKKSKFMPWDEEEATVPTKDDQQQQSLVLSEANVAGKDPGVTVEAPVKETAEYSVEQPSPKKSKKKDNKSKFVNFDEDEPPSTPLENKEIPLDSTPFESAPNIEIPNDIQPVELEEEAANTFFEPPKEIKKGEKSKFVDCIEESSASSPKDDTSPRDPVFTETAIVPEGVGEASEKTKQEEEAADSFEDPSSKKGKKKGKKSKFVDWDEKPSVAPPTNKIDQQEPVPTESEPVIEQFSDIQKPTEEGKAAFPADDSSIVKKGKKKGKKSKYVEWDEEPSIPPPKDETNQQEPVPTESESTLAQVNELQPAEEQEAIVPRDELAIGKKEEKKKEKKPKFVGFNDEPSIPLVNDEPATSLSGAPQEVDRTRSDLPTEDVGVVQSNDDLVTRAAKTKKDKKNAKKAKALSLDEQLPPAAEEPPLLETEDPSRGLDHSASKLSDERTGNVSEPISADQIEQVTATEITGQRPDSPVFSKIEAAKDTDILPDASVDITEGTKNDKEDMSATVPETILEPDHGAPDRPLTMPLTDVIAVHEKTIQDLAHDNADLESHHGLEQQVHVVEESVPPPSDQPVQNASPLLLQADDVHVGPQSHISTEGTLEVAEAETQPTPPDETDIDRLAFSDDVAKEPSELITLSAALEDSELDKAQEMAPSPQHDKAVPALSANAPVEPGEPLQSFEAEVNDAAEEFALVSKKDKKKAKKSKKAVALEGEMLVDVQDENATMDERVKEEGRTFDQPIAEPTTIPEEAPEDPLSISRKEKKKSKKKNKPSYFDDEPSKSTTLVEPDPKVNAVVEEIAEEPVLPPQPTAMEETGDLQPMSKDKKKGKKGKQALNSFDEPSPSTPQAEIEPKEDIAGQIVDEPSLPTEPSISEGFGPTPLTKKEKKKSKKAKSAFNFDEEPSVDTAPAEPSLDDTPNVNNEQTALPIEPDLAATDAGFLDSGKKGKKKSKKNRKASIGGQEPLEKTMPTESEPEPAIDEPVLSAEHSVALAEENFPEPTKKDKQAFNFDDELSEHIAREERLFDEASAERIGQPPLFTEPLAVAPEEDIPDLSKKAKNVFALDDDPLESKTSVEPIIEKAPAEQIEEPSFSPEALMDIPVENTPHPSKKVKTSEKGKKAFDLDEETSENLTLAEPDTSESELLVDQQLPEPIESSFTKTIEEFPPASSKKDKKSKKAKKATTSGDELSEITIPVKFECLEQDVEQPPVTADASTAVAPKELFGIKKDKDKESEKDRKSRTFGDEVLETPTPVQPETHEEDLPFDLPPVATEASIAEALDDVPTTSSKKQKKSKKNKKTVAFDDEVESAPLVEPEDLQRHVGGDEPPLPTDTSLAEATEEFPVAPSKKDKKSKKNKKAFMLEDEAPLKTPMPEVVNPTIEELAVPADPSAPEAVDDFGFSSKKDRKKAKKGKKASACDEPAESMIPAESSVPSGSTGIDVPKDFVTETKKDKKGKKAKKALAWDDETLEPSPVVEEAITLDEPSQAAPLPSVSQLKRSKPAEISPQVSSPNLEAQTENTIITLEGQPMEQAPTVTAMPEVDKPVEMASPERAIDLEVKQSDAVFTSKKSKKDKKEKNPQAFKWDDDEDTANPPLPETATSMKDVAAPLPEIQEGRPLGNVNEEAGLAVPPSFSEAPEQMQIIEPLAASQLVEQVRAPRHQDPTLATPASIDIPSAAPPPPLAKEALDQQGIAGSEQIQKPISQPVASAVGSIEEQVPSTARETSLPNDEEFISFTPTKKSKKGKKGRKQVIDWEDDTIPRSEPVQEPSKAVGVTDIASRPEMMAWPTEVRLNQTSATSDPKDRPMSPVDVVEDQSVSQDQYLADEPQEPAPVEDDRSDYFGHEPSRDLPNQPPPFEDDSLYAPPSPAQLPSTEAGPTKIGRSGVYDDVPVNTSRKGTDQPASAAEQAQPQDITAGPVDGFEDLATTKKDKKAKRKKKQALDDVLWEFPSIPPTTEVTSVESIWPSDPSRGDRLHIEPPRGVSTNEPQDPAGSERNTQADFAAAVPNEQDSGTVVDTPRQAGMEGEPAILEEPRVEDAVDEDRVAVSKKAKKGKKSKKSKSTDYFAEPEPDTQEAAKGFEEVKDTSRLDDRPSSPGVGTIEAIAAAAAVSAGLSTAQGLSRKESKKDKKKKDRQASSTWTEPVEDVAPRGEAATEDSGLKNQSRTPTPERRSPIQAWHQNFSPSQSPRHSELYDIEDEQPRSAASIQRKRNRDDEAHQSQGAERRSPIQAWHQYDTPGQSPRQSELYDYDPSESRATGGRASASAINRDSAVHVSDSPIVSQQSPVRRAMRDSGYPDTEGSPIVSQGAEKREHIDESTRDFRQGDHESVSANPLQILSEDTTKRRQQKKRTRSRSPSRHENETEDLYLPPRHPRPDLFDDLREPSPVSSTTKDRSSVLFQSSPFTREEQTRREEKGDAKVQGSPAGHGSHQDVGEQISHPAGQSFTPPREDNSAMVNARAESLATLSGLGGVSEEQGRSLFGGPVGISSDDNTPTTPMDQEGLDRRRLNTITEYSPEESPLHKKNRDVSDVGVSAHGVKAARRSGTPQPISKRRARSPLAGGVATPSADDAASRPFWPSIDEEKQPLDVERSQSRNTEQRPSSHQSNISSLVSGPPKQREYERRSFSGASNHSIESINAIIRTPPDQMRSASGMSNRSSGTPPLRRADRSVSSDLRGANRKSEANKRAKQPEAEPQEVDTSISVPLPSTTPNDSTKDKSNKGRVKAMADVFEGYGDFHSSPLSPTRPPSVRRRQSMQVLELESKNDRLIAENRQLHEARLRAERDLEDAAHGRSEEIDSYRQGIETRETWLRQKDTELSQLRETIESLQAQVAQLDEVNQRLHASVRSLDNHQERYSQVEEEHAATHQKWQQSTRELEDLRQQHAQLSAGMEDIVRHEVTTALESKNLELHRLQSNLSSAQSQIRTLQAQIIASKQSSSSDSLLSRDEDYFDNLCQSLCTHVQQWVLRFSKFSDSRACYLASEIRDEKIVDRMENSILDGSDVDTYLADRVKRRDVFMSIFMTMTWEYIFTRYLFGADREQRQKLKSLEKTLAESPQNSRQAIHKWRATTLHLLSRREAFVKQRETDTEAVMQTIYSTLATILPPPSHLVPQIQTSLSKVLNLAVDLSIEMRTQRFEYVMLPPLQPEYDTNGDLARKVYFNASLMNERSSASAGDG